jgi:hypothetical protein
MGRPLNERPPLRAARKRAHPGARVKLVTRIPSPKVPMLCEVNGVTKTLSEWARASGIKKNTLYSRLAAGLTMAEAIQKTFPALEPAGKLPGNSGSKRARMVRVTDDPLRQAPD